MLPDGFSSRIVAQSGSKPSVNSSYVWHKAPDGGASFRRAGGGWIYVSNSEVGNDSGGVGAIQFDSAGNIVDAYSILENTNENCAGGATPWNTWLSCEEHEDGAIWECDPYGNDAAIKRPALGIFVHEAVTLDTLNNVFYMTEDKPDGCFYRFVSDSTDSDGIPSLTSGILEVAVVDIQTSIIDWIAVPDPSASDQATRDQVDSSSTFKGGEGIVFYNGIVSFATKRDDKIWSYDTESKRISVIYDADTHSNPILTGVDNITLSKEGELVIGEDGGNLQVVAITKSNRLVPLAQLVGHDSSEITGPAFSPDGKRLYFSSQRGTSGNVSDGITYEISGPFHG